MTISSNQPVSNFTQQNKTANFLIDRGLRRTQNTRSLTASATQIEIAVAKLKGLESDKILCVETS